MLRHFVATVAVFSLVLFSSCGSDDGSSAGIPLVKPPVDAATPSGLTSRSRTLDVSEIRSRFFSAGPTKISSLLDSIDSRITEINTRSAEESRDCLSATPVAQSISIFGTTQTAYFQCYDLFGDGSGGMVFGTKDGVWYLYTNVGTQRSFSTVSLVSGTTDKYSVEAWISVGQSNAASAATCSSTWYGCSYGVIHLSANSATDAIEMTVAGTGFGYCGAQLKSEGTNLFVKGDAGGGTSDGSTWSCLGVDTLCSLATDTSQAGDCTAIGEAQFTLSSLGVTGESAFGSNVTLDGLTSDSVHFGMSVSEMSQIAGVSAF